MAQASACARCCPRHSYIADSLLNSLRLQNSELRIAAKEGPEELVIDWTGVPRPENERAKMSNLQTSDTPSFSRLRLTSDRSTIAGARALYLRTPR